MKQRKKWLAVLLAVVSMAVCALLFGCNQKTCAYTVEKNEETLLVVKADETKTDVSLFDVLKELAEGKEIELTYSESEYGAYITSVNGTVPDAAKGEYWMLYTTLTTIEGDEMIYSSSEYGSYDLSGTVCGMANVGASSLPMVDGCYYVLALVTLSW